MVGWKAWYTIAIVSAAALIMLLFAYEVGEERYSVGYGRGYAAAQEEFCSEDDSYAGYYTGYEEGTDEGYTNGYNDGWEEGYRFALEEHGTEE